MKKERKLRVMEPYIDDGDFKTAKELIEKKWITSGTEVRKFEDEFANYLGKRFGVAVNSGSSANLVMIETLKALQYLKSGTRVIMPSLNWGTTVSPILQAGFKPIFLDITLDREHFLTLDKEQVEKALGEFKGNIVFPIYTLGFVPRKEVLDVSLMVDCCDALNKVPKSVLITSYSFFMAHHLVTGEGGMMVTNEEKISRMGRAIRDTGRKCYIDCPFWTKGNICRQITDPEFICPHADWRMSFEIPAYNLKMLDLCASIGRSQLTKVEIIMKLRKRNAKLLIDGLKKLETYGLIIPKYTEDASWFSFPIIVPGKREEMIKFLNSKRIETRPILSGNITKQNLLKGYKYSSYLLENTNLVHDQGFMIGCHPNLTLEDIGFITEQFKKYFEEEK